MFGSAKHIDEDGEKLIKEAFQNCERQPSGKSDNLSIDKANTNIDRIDNLSIDKPNASIDKANTNIDKSDNLSIDKPNSSIDNSKTTIDKPYMGIDKGNNQLPTTDIPKDTLMDILLKQSETLKQQLEIKDRQIEQLQNELITERQHNRSQSDKLAVLATQAQTLQLAQLSEDKIKSEESTQKIHWWSKRKGDRNNGRKKDVC